MSRLIHAAVLSSRGRVRDNNEDAFYLNGQYPELNRMNESVSICDSFPIDNAVFAVCDGIGGHDNGEEAAFCAVSSLPQYQKLLKDGEFYDTTAEWVRTANQTILTQAGGGGCTLALMSIKDDCVRIAHIGDSRVYRWYNNELIRMTRDHSKIQMLMDAGLITESQARVHPQRHVITRYLGMDTDEHGMCAATLERPMPILNHDKYLICSDGITDMLSDEHISALMTSNTSVKSAAQGIYQAALDAGGRDNLTLILIEFEVDEEYKPLASNRASAQPQDDSFYDRTDNPTQSYYVSASSPTVLCSQTHSLKNSDGGLVTIKSEVSQIDSLPQHEIKIEIKSTITQQPHIHC